MIRKCSCLKCCVSKNHKSKECDVNITCEECGSTSHITLMHNSSRFGGEVQHGGEGKQSTPVNSRCTEICGTGVTNPKSCAKVLLAKVYCNNNPDNIVQCYVIIDDQSNKTLAKPELFDKLCVKGDKFDYCINSCSGTSFVSGRKLNDCTIMSLDNEVSYKLPTVLEYDDMPGNKDEICLSEYACQFAHLSHVADNLPSLDTNAGVLMLIGRDLVDAHHVLEQVTGPPGTPLLNVLVWVGLLWVRCV